MPHCRKLSASPGSDHPGGPGPRDEENPADSEFLASFGRSDGGSTEWYSPEPAGYVRGRTRYVVVLGTVMSGLGKGVFSSSLVIFACLAALFFFLTPAMPRQQRLFAFMYIVNCHACFPWSGQAALRT